jgi:outer membrane protein OmpA-like peptidoglycan-associated protein
MMLRNALLAATILALPVAAQAQPVTGLYVAGGLGGDYLMDAKTRLSSNPSFVNAVGKLRSRGGFVGVGSVGYGLGNGLRIELEANGRSNHVNVKNGSGATTVRGGGDLITYGAMINALYDFNIGSSVMPYVGVGGGYVFNSLNSFSAYAPGGNPAFPAKSGDMGSPAVQAILGVAFPITAAPGLAVTAEYRFLSTVQDRKFGGAITNGAAVSGGQLKVDPTMHHSLLVGLRYNFGVGPAAVVTTAAAVAPAPAPARSYLVFFDWDKADLTARAQQIIAEAASNSTRVASTRIDVAGHADKSGTPAYNQGLSLRRANNVAAELVRLGVPRTAISISAFGDTKPLVPTAAGVREPQNRRVEIVLR